MLAGGGGLCGRCYHQVLQGRSIRLGRCCSRLKIYVPCFISMFSYGFSLTMLFPFLPFMVQFLLPDISEEDTGKYAGIIAGAFFVGQFLSNFVWGTIADAKGRKPVLIVTSILSAGMSVVFGFSVNFPMAVFTRFLAGLLNAVSGTVRAVVSENSDDSNHAFGMSLMSTAITSGFIFGPAVAGTTSDPIRQYNLTINNSAVHSFFLRFPYSMPCVVTGLIYVIAAVIVAVWLPEASGKKNSGRIFPKILNLISRHKHNFVSSRSEDSDGLNKEEEEEEEEENLSTDQINFDGSVSANEEATNTYDEDRGHDHQNHDQDYQDRASSPLIIGDQLVVDDHKAMIRPSLEPDSSTTCIRLRLSLKRRLHGIYASFINYLQDIKLFIKNKSTCLSLLTFCLYSLAITGFVEVYSLWCATSRYQGGLGFSLHDIGVALSIAGAVVLPVSLIYFPVLNKFLGTINTYNLSAIFQVVALLLLPNLHYIEIKPLLWVLLLALSILMRLMLMACFAANFVFISNSVPLNKVGAINGLSMSLTALFRAIAPVFAGSIYSVSLTDGLSFPLNYHLIFIIFAIIILIAMVMVACLPKTINRQKRRRSLAMVNP